MKPKTTLFLGGTTADSTWRDSIIHLLEKENLPYFNPVVKDWDDDARDKEYSIKSNPMTIELYVISKEMSGVFSIAEAVDASNKKPEQTIFMIKREGFDKGALKSLDATSELIKKNGGKVVATLEECVKLYKTLSVTQRVVAFLRR